MELSVLNTKGEATGRKVKLPSEVFGVEPNDHAIYLDVKQYLANQRQGTHKAKQKNEISGSTRKLHRQKGTGGSRKGSIKSPVFRGGGRVFGPQPRDYSFKLNKKLKSLARVSALSYKANQKNITVIEDFAMDAPKTKQFNDIISSLKLSGKKTLLVLAKQDRNIHLSARNTVANKTAAVADLNTHDILNANNLVLLESSIQEISNQLSK
jgi:large subunit ribosomal protein L4